jgi:hypothetical protein
MDIPQALNRFDSARVEKRGPSMVIRVPLLWTIVSLDWRESIVIERREVQNGFAELIWATQPFSKKVLFLPLVKSNSWSGITISPGE